MVEGLADPLASVRVAAALDRELGDRGVVASLNTDFVAFAETRRRLRDGPEAPLFDFKASSATPSKAFWMSLTGKDGRIVALQAFRADHVEPTLADWALGWILGIYLKREELIIPDRIEAPPDSVARRFSGTLAYHGELWLHPDFRGRQLMQPFARLGVLLAYIRWRPTAVWALNDDKMALEGRMTRMGYSHQERGFLHWRFLPGSASASEWLSIADRASLEQLIGQMDVKGR